jgi:hypothetical protein
LVASISDVKKARIAAEGILNVLSEPAADMDNLSDEGFRPVHSKFSQFFNQFSEIRRPFATSSGRIPLSFPSNCARPSEYQFRNSARRNFGHCWPFRLWQIQFDGIDAEGKSGIKNFSFIYPNSFPFENNTFQSTNSIPEPIFCQISRKKQTIQEGDMSFESSKFLIKIG